MSETKELAQKIVQESRWVNKGKNTPYYCIVHNTGKEVVNVERYNQKFSENLKHFRKCTDKAYAEEKGMPKQVVPYGKTVEEMETSLRSMVTRYTDKNFLPLDEDIYKEVFGSMVDSRPEPMPDFFADEEMLAELRAKSD